MVKRIIVPNCRRLGAGGGAVETGDWGRGTGDGSIAACGASQGVRRGSDRQFSAKRAIEIPRFRWYANNMNTIRYVYWQDEDMWLGYLEEFPDYMTQGVNLEELQENLRDIYDDLIGGKIPGVRHVAELTIA